MGTSTREATGQLAGGGLGSLIERLRPPSWRAGSAPPTVFVTGGSQGIGLAIAKEYARQGAILGLFARDAVRLLAAKQSLEEAGRSGVRVGVYAMDVGDEADVRAMIARARAELGAPDVLVNSAGIIAGNRFERIASAEFEAVIRTNLLGAANTIRALLPDLRERRGRIVNVASVAGLVGMYGYTAYAASKYGLVGFSECLRAELRPEGVSVTVVCPPEVPTALLEQERETLPRAARAVKRLAGVLPAEAVAKAAVAAAARRQFLVVPGLKARVVTLTHALSLGFLSRTTADAVVALYDR